MFLAKTIMRAMLTYCKRSWGESIRSIDTRALALTRRSRVPGWMVIIAQPILNENDLISSNMSGYLIIACYADPPNCRKCTWLPPISSRRLSYVLISILVHSSSHPSFHNQGSTRSQSELLQCSPKIHSVENFLGVILRETADFQPFLLRNHGSNFKKACIDGERFLYGAARKLQS